MSPLYLIHDFILYHRHTCTLWTRIPCKQLLLNQKCPTHTGHWVTSHMVSSQCGQQIVLISRNQLEATVPGDKQCSIRRTHVGGGSIQLQPPPLPPPLWPITSLVSVDTYKIPMGARCQHFAILNEWLQWVASGFVSCRHVVCVPDRMAEWVERQSPNFGYWGIQTLV